MSMTKVLFNSKCKEYTTRTKGKISIHFNPHFANLPYVQIGNKENLIQFYEAINYKHRPEFIKRHIPWQHYNWLLAWRPIAIKFDERMREITSQNKNLLEGMIPNQPPAEPLDLHSQTKLDDYKRRSAGQS